MTHIFNSLNQIILLNIMFPGNIILYDWSLEEVKGK